MLEGINDYDDFLVWQEFFLLQAYKDTSDDEESEVA